MAIGKTTEKIDGEKKEAIAGACVLGETNVISHQS
jgi:hypothetical protein